MISTVKSLLQKLGEIPEGTLSVDYHKTPGLARTIVFGNYAYPSGLFIHFILLIVFASIGVIPLALFNVVSVTLWIIAIALHRKGYTWQAYYLITVEIIAHAAACIIVIGWDAGFQYYVLVQPAVVFLLPGSATKKTVISAIYSGAYVAMSYYADLIVPWTELGGAFISAFNYGNIFSVCGLLAYLAYQYSRAAIIAEEKLENEHRKTNAALIARNQALERLERELSEAADYVRKILPPPVAAGTVRTDWRFVPSTSLGGDAFGYHWVDEDLFAAYLIDVSGHGVGAALLSVSVVNVLRSQSLPHTDFKDPVQVLEALNGAFPSQENNDMFFTIWYGIYNNRSNELIYASGGHPPALLLGETAAGEATATLLRTPNYVIGGMPAVTYQKRKCAIGEGSRLYIFSDGVYEVEKSDGSMWRFQEFSEFMLSLKTGDRSRLDRLYHHVKTLGTAEKLEDDFTILEVALR